MYICIFLFNSMCIYIYKEKTLNKRTVVPLHKMWFAWPIQSLLHHLQEQDVCPVNRPYQNRKHHTHFLAFLEHFIKRHLPEFNHSFQISFKKNNNAGFFVLFIFQFIYLKLFQLFISWGLNSSVLFFPPPFLLSIWETISIKQIL